MNYKKYTKYKNSDIPWLGEIPEEWKSLDVRRLFLKNEVKNIKLEETNLLTLSYGFVKQKNIETANGLLPASFDNYQILKKGMIVLRMLDLQNDKNSLRVGYVNETGIITSAYIGLESIINNNTKYFYYLLHFMDLIKHFYNGGGGVRQSIGFTDFRRERIILPPKPEQTAIANFLDHKLEKIERFITKKKQLIELLNEQKAAIINEAVTKGVPPNDELLIMNDGKNGELSIMNGELEDKNNIHNSQFTTHNYKDSGIEWLGDIPESWEVKKLKFVANCFPSNIDKHTKDDEEQVRLCNYTDVYKNDFIINEMDLMIATAKKEQIEKFTLLENDVIITKDSETADDIANPALVTETLENVVCGYHLSVLRPYKILDGGYLFRALQCKPINVQFELTSLGVTRVGLGVYDMKSAKIPVPPKGEQKEIFTYIQKELDKIDKTITTVEKEISLVEEYKTALIAEAVTGKIDVRDFEILQKEMPLAMAAEETVNYNKEN